MNFTEFVTRSALNKPVTVINGLDKVLKEQKAIGRNLNQLTMLCNMGKIVCPDLSEMIDRYSAVYDRLNDRFYYALCRRFCSNGSFVCYCFYNTANRDKSSD
jgi:hypothetical protein